MLLAGFETVDSGTILLRDRDISRVPPNKRDIGMVFQRYALFPHLSVVDNVAFPLKMRGLARNARHEKARAALDIVRLDGMAERMPAELSGGQQQRVALARAIVFEPKLLLMDEPLGALDLRLRQQMQIELKELQRRLGATVIFVTHDQGEALAMSDRIAIVNQGRIEQLGEARALYERPASAFVGDFIGEINLIEGKVLAVDQGSCRIATATGEMTGTPSVAGALRAGDAIRAGIRPERLTLHPVAPTAECFPGIVRQNIFNGNSVTLHIEAERGGMIRAVVLPTVPAAALAPGERVWFSVDPRDVLIFPERAS
jgi:ABC-type Fe3+/spermidine/putrescine transport system ATPase subunit